MAIAKVNVPELFVDSDHIDCQFACENNKEFNNVW
jgi:hypothetical protein